MLALSLLGCPSPKQLQSATALPQVAVHTETGEKASLSTLTQGKVAVIDLWATWCTPCKENLPKLERLSQAYQSAGLVVIGVDVGEADKQKVMTFAKEAKVTYPLYFDPEFQFTDSLGAAKVPTLLVLDRDGRVVHRSADLNEETLSVIKAQLQQ